MPCSGCTFSRTSRCAWTQAAACIALHTWFTQAAPKVTLAKMSRCMVGVQMHSGRMMGKVNHLSVQPVAFDKRRDGLLPLMHVVTEHGFFTKHSNKCFLVKIQESKCARQQQVKTLMGNLSRWHWSLRKVHMTISTTKDGNRRWQILPWKSSVCGRSHHQSETPQKQTKKW